MTLPLGARGGRQTETVAGAGGSIDIRAREGLILAGTLAAAGGNASAAGGSLSLVLDREAVAGTADYPAAERNLLVAAAGSAAPAVAGADSPITGIDGQGFVPAGAIDNGGFDWVSLKSQNTLSFDLGAGNLGLQARAGLIIDGPAIAAAGAQANAAASLSAPYVALGNSDWRYQSAAPTATASAAGGVTLSVQAATVDVVGNSVLVGFDRAAISAAGDIRLVGQVPVDLSVPASATPSLIQAVGAFTVAGAMDFTAAQVYPTSMSWFQLTATGPGSRIAFNGNGNGASPPLSAAGSLRASADEIDQNGVLRAPLGQIVLTAADRLNYGAGSLTSVAGSGVTPLGFVQNGNDWLYDFGNGNTVNLSDGTASNYFALPDKSIQSLGASVTFAKGAVLDLSGGGDLYAYEFTPGPGGSTDVLAKAAGSTTAGVFAILPGYVGAVAPRDFQYAQDGGLKPGDSVYLSGFAGLAAGYYTLLPAHYALLPGAYSISALAGTTDMTAAADYARPDGSSVVAGRRSYLGGGADNRWSGFLVTPSSLVRQYSEFTDYSGNAFQAALPALPRDGGHAVFDVGQSLVLDGLVRLTAAPGGSNGIADISAPEIAIVAEASDPLPAGSGAGALKLATADLAAMGADSLLIGGVRTVGSGGDQVSVGANDIVVGRDADHPVTLAGPEVILAAVDTVKVNAGATVSGEGALGRRPRTLTLTNKSAPGQGADGALLRASSGAAVAVQRSFTAPDGTISAPAGATGTLDVEGVVKAGAGGSVLLDATRSTTIADPLKLAAGVALGLGASAIDFGSGAPVVAGRLRFDDTALAALNSVSALAFTSYSTIDIYGAVNLGALDDGGLPSMQSLSFAAGSLRAMAGADTPQATFTARTVRFDQAGTDAATAPVAGSSVIVNANDIEAGNGVFALHGFASARLAATNEIRAVGTGGGLAADADLTLAAGRITARSGADAAFTAGGALTLTQGAGPVGALPALEFGGKLAFKGNSVLSDATIVALAGAVSLAATNGVAVTGGGISATGGAETFGSTVAYAPAGSIVLDGGSGDVTVGANAVLDVSAVGAAAG
ncbi:MAG TPA: hypothetical protein VMB75_03310, partial [Rhodocyclaceae bacterium]|nr:hypothetical protein [Rhodocyclaceae bacterium]